jgi:hypothetical protein
VKRLPRAEVVLPIVIFCGAVVLAASEFMIAFEFTPPGGEVQMEQTVADRHSYAMLVLSVFAVIALVGALVTASRPAAFAVAALGGLALLLFLVLDLPDAGKIGPLEDFITAKAEPQIGFWLEALGAIALGLGGVAFATLSTEQLRAGGARYGFGRSGPPRGGPTGPDERTENSAPGPTEAPGPEPAAEPSRPPDGRRTAVPLGRPAEETARKRGRGRGRFARPASRRPRPR